jgi:cytochrome c peroxidase
MRLGSLGVCLFATLLLPMAAGAEACPDHLRFLGPQCAAWQADILPAALPPARDNAVADRQDAAVLGMKIFFDNRFSRPGSGVACASCHDPEHAFAENKPRSNTLREVARNAPDLIDAAWYRDVHFWDGKVDMLWSAPLFTLEQPDEMDSTRLHVVQVLSAIYKDRYEAIFGPLPDLARLPQAGKPGMAEFDSLPAEDKAAVNRAYANVGKALEAYIRKLAAGRAPFDDFLMGSQGALSPAAQRGMVAFTAYGCQSCHAGPTFSDETFHQLGLPPAGGHAPDPGRAGAGFRTPSLRNVAVTGPYGHDGSLDTLDQAIGAHARILAVPTGQDKADIVAFLRALTGRPPQRPWNYWPGG